MTAGPAALRDGQVHVVPALRRALERLDPASRGLSAYHHGFTDVDGLPREGGGKAIRSALALLSARAAGAPVEVGIPGAVAVELVHDFSLLHDDLMDGDVQRRHQPTVWSRWGPSSAILTGDALLVLALQVLLEPPRPAAAEAARLLADATQDLVRGQVEDLALERCPEATLEQVLSMAAGKTGALLSVSSAIGAVLAGAPPALVHGLHAFGLQLGLAFQLVDDLLGIWGDPEVTGKPVLSDLRARKVTLPVAYALGTASPAAAELREWLSRPGPDTEAQLRDAAALVQEAGAAEWTRQEAHCRFRLAERALQGQGIPPDVLAELLELAQFVVDRQT
jgi:geranylgeranyl diphosphate synthase type I